MAPLDPEPDLPAEKPLAAAAARLPHPYRKKKPEGQSVPKVPRPKGPTPRLDPKVVIGMKAAGLTNAQVAGAMDVTRQTVLNTLDRIPDSRDQIADLREKLKLTKIARANRVEGPMWDRLEKEVKGGDARDIDAVARALLASEKIQAGVAGEGAASGAAAVPTSPVDLKILIQQLVGQ